ncbi:hypothetical protein HYV86_06030 [Candidatus Woesearchaeota archaeon]|nr:hypothetical protein [Candidatus Woesearchaeota archaeon]
MGIVEDARVYAVLEIEKTGLPNITHFEISEKKAIQLAKVLKADEKIVQIGVYFMDLKLGQAMKENRLTDHIPMAVTAAQEFFKVHKISKPNQEKIINCIQAHHKEIPFTCIEAEICANADCYRFIHPKGFFAYLTILGKRYSNLNECLEQAERKMDEKYKTLSLPLCKKELAPYYKNLKQYLKDARYL